MRSANMVTRGAGAGMRHQIHASRCFAGKPSNARSSERVVHRASASTPEVIDGIARSSRVATMKSRGRDCGTNEAASITIAPKRYPTLNSSAQIARKSLPSCEVNVPQTFSRTSVDGARPASAIDLISDQYGQNVPDRSPRRPAPPPARERSWQGKEAQAKSAVPGTSSARILLTSPIRSESSRQFAR